MTTKIIGTRGVSRDYGFSGIEAIVETEKGRLLIQDGFGGIDSIRGGAVRWEHGLVHQLKADDTFTSLDDVVNDAGSTLQDCMTYGTDDARPQLLWDGYALANFAKSVGL